MKEGFIYFIIEIDTLNIKIGFTEFHPNIRLKSLQTGNSSKLELIGYIDGDKSYEKEIHSNFLLKD